MPDAIRGQAITQVNDALRPGEKLVLTCRTESYKAPLRAAAAIELRPLDPGTTARYLLHDARAVSGATVGTGPGSPGHPSARGAGADDTADGRAGTCLFNPRAGESGGDLPDPAELLSPDLDNQAAVQGYLFDAYIPAAYRKRPGAAASWSAAQATPWLAFLAWELEHHSTTDLEWWNLPRWIPRHLVGLLTAIAMGVISAAGYPFTGLGTGLLSGLAAGLIARKWAPLHKKRNLAAGLAGGLAGGVIAAVIALAVLGFGIRSYRTGAIPASGLAIGIAMTSMGSFVASFAGGLAGGTVAAFYQQAPAFEGLRTAIGSGSHLIDGLGFGLTALLLVELASRTSPARGSRWSPAWFAVGAAAGLILGITAWIQAGALAGLAAGPTRQLPLKVDGPHRPGNFPAPGRPNWLTARLAITTSGAARRKARHRMRRSASGGGPNAIPLIPITADLPGTSGPSRSLSVSIGSTRIRRAYGSVL